MKNGVTELDKLTHHGPKIDPLRVLIVDDDIELAKHYSLILTQAGIETRFTPAPSTVCEHVSSFNPDLILMDLYMPNCSGIELSKIIRQHPQYTHIPIVFLSTEAAVEKQLFALRVGGDDFLTKPISDDFLFRSIAIRAERARVLNDLMARDSLTGLIKHSVIKERLEAEISRSVRGGSPLSYAMLDIDLFKQINDTHGHSVGDQVIKSMARMLRSNLRESDIIGRYGGEEFAVIMPECDVKNAVEALESVRQDFSALHHQSNKGEFSVTFSAGVAEWAENINTADKLNKTADAALYHAKNNGRNNIQKFRQSDIPE